MAVRSSGKPLPAKTTFLILVVKEVLNVDNRAYEFSAIGVVLCHWLLYFLLADGEQVNYIPPSPVVHFS
jgi:hypothetical protein